MQNPYTSLLFVCFLSFFFLSLEAQVFIKTQPTSDIAVCQSPEKLEIEIRANATFTEFLEVTIDLPLGVSYVLQSLQVADIPVGLEMEENHVSDLSAPVFQIKASAASPFNDGEKIVFSIEREADCLAVNYAQSGGTFEDLIVVEFEGGNEQELGAPYNVLFASLALFVDNNWWSSLVGSVREREVSIVNGGLACSGDVSYQIDFHKWKATLEEVSFEGIALPFEENEEGVEVHLSEEEFLKIGNGDACFDNGEEILLKLRFRFSCNPNHIDFHHSVSWGCKDAKCNASEPAISFINIFQSSSNRLQYKATQVERPTCLGSDYEGYLVNIHEEVLTDMQLRFDWAFGDAEDKRAFDIVAAKVNGMTFPVDDSYSDVGVYLLDFQKNDNPDIGLRDTDSDGFYDDMLPQDTLFFLIESVYKCDLLDGNEFEGGLWSSIFFTEGCGIERSKYIGNLFKMSRNLGHHYVSGETDIWNNGEDYTFEFCTTGSQEFECAGNNAELELQLPPSLKPIRAYLSDGTPLYLQDGAWGITVVSGLKGVANHCVHVDFQLDCTCNETPKILDFDWDYVYYCNGGCSCKKKFFEGEYRVYTHCSYTPEECDITIIGGGEEDFEGCLRTLSAKVERASLGWTDFTFTEYVEANEDSIHLDLALPCDSIRFKTDAVVVSTLADNAYLQIDYNAPFAREALEYSSGTVHFYDAQSGNSYDCPLSTEAAKPIEVGGNLWRIELNLTETLGDCYPKKQLGLWDSINFEGYLVVLEDEYGFNESHDFTPFRFMHYWINNSWMKLGCDNVGDRMFVNGYGEIGLDGTNVYLKSCLESTIALNFAFGDDLSGNLFPNELRPNVLVDSIEVWIPEEFIYTQGSASFTYYPNEALPVQDPKIEENLENGFTRLLFTNDGTWSLGDKIQGYTLAGFLEFDLTNTCTTAKKIDFTYYYQTNYYSGNSNCMESKSESISKAFSLNSNYTSVVASNYNSKGFSRQEVVNYRLCSSAGELDILPYLIIPQASENIQVLEVWMPDPAIPFQQTELENGDLLITFDGFEWRDTPNPHEVECFNINVKIEHSECNEDNQLQIYESYVCKDSSYPESLENLGCAADQEGGNINPQPAEVQLQVNPPSENLNLCESFVYEFVINSAQLANIYEPILQIDVPPLGGVFLADNPTIEYPLGTGERAFSAEINQTMILIDLASADLETTPSANILENGIQGLGLGTTDTRKAIVRLPLTTDCNFISGSSMRVTLTANRPCGEPASGSGSTQILEPIFIEGAVPSYITLTTIDSEAVSYCEANSTVKVEIVNEGPVSTSANEHCYIFLPQEVKYVEGSTQNLTANEVAEPLQSEQSNLTQLDFTMPENVAKNETIVFTFNVDASELANCENAQTEFIAQTIEFIPIYCVSEDTNCDLPVKTSEDTGFFDITIGGPKMNLSAESHTGCVFLESNNELSVEVKLTNSGNKAVLTENIVVDVYFDVNENGLLDDEDVFWDSLLYDQIIEVNEKVVLNGEWTVESELYSHILFVLEAEHYCKGCEDLTFSTITTPASSLNLDSEITCKDSSQLYNVYVYMQDGTPPYAVTGSRSFTIPVDFFYIPNTPWGEPLEFFIEDGGGCRDTIVINDLCTVSLGVELLYFEGEAAAKGNLLQWRTVSETDNHHFILKRSIDGKNFETIAQINGAGTTQNPQDYSYLDPHPFNGITYYQLLQTDLDGRTENLKTISIDRQNALSKLKIYTLQPVPAIAFFYLQYHNPKAQELDLQVFNINHQPVYQQKIRGDRGVNDWRVDCSDWASGVYILQLSSEKEAVFMKLILQ